MHEVRLKCTGSESVVDEMGITVRLLREELQLLHEPGSYVGEIVKVMGKKKVLVKVQPEGKYSMCWTLLNDATC
jgi:ATP-dependent 26S proteasome regulatory subunit